MARKSKGVVQEFSPERTGDGRLGMMDEFCRQLNALAQGLDHEPRGARQLVHPVKKQEPAGRPSR
jgi:hypothetical protein